MFSYTIGPTYAGVADRFAVENQNIKCAPFIKSWHSYTNTQAK
jgi:hypothetical protein